MTSDQDVEMIPVKRPGDNENGSAKKKLKGHTMPRNALMLLSDFRKGLVYTETNDGNASSPLFVCSVMVDNETYTGQAPSKKKAKIFCAQNAITQLIEQINNHIADKYGSSPGTESLMACFTKNADTGIERKKVLLFIYLQWFNEWLE